MDPEPRVGGGSGLQQKMAQKLENLSKWFNNHEHSQNTKCEAERAKCNVDGFQKYTVSMFFIPVCASTW